MNEQNLISQETLRQLYIEKCLAIRPIAKLLKHGEATVLRYLNLYQIKLRPQNQSKGRKLSPEHIEKIRKNRTGTHASPETKRKLSLMRKGRTYNRPKRIENERGYIFLWMPTHHLANKTGYVAEHRLVIEQLIGRKLLPHEVVHHLNGIKGDNRSENLICMTRSAHQLHHNEERREAMSIGMKIMRKKRCWSSKKK
jgi:hypothetical protein